jgi:hypothetical protein
MKEFLSSWKTNLCAILIIALVVLYNLNIIKEEQITTSVPIIVALGLAFSKDNNKYPD